MLALTAALILPTMVPTALAEDDEGGFIEEGEEGSSKKKRGGESAGEIREITRGFYAKTGVGAATYLGGFSQAVSTGTFVGLSLGMDFVDTEKQSMAWEISLNQGLHNGVDVFTQYANGCTFDGGGPLPCTEGDLRTYAVSANYEISFYPSRRVGVGFRAGGGVLYSPVLVDAQAWEEDVIGGEFGGYDPGWHNAPKPVFFGGPTLEYYTKLSHFSVGIDADVFYGLGWDLGLNAAGTLKYTF